MAVKGFRFWLLWFGLGVSTLVWADTPNFKMALIIDDMGHNVQRGRKAINLPVPLTLAFLPNRHFTRALAKYGHNKGQEVIVHLPMENASGFPLGELGLTRNLNPEQRQQVLLEAISAVPYAVGLNNHLGSELTRHREVMDWLMGELKLRDLYFIDSATTVESVALQAAQDIGLPVLRRHVFLDNQLTAAELDRQFQRAIRIGQKQGQVVVIAHPHPETLAFLAMRLPLAKQYDSVEFVQVSDMLAHQLPHLAAQIAAAKQAKTQPSSLAN